jgi:hypothetical protein
LQLINNVMDIAYQNNRQHTSIVHIYPSLTV